ncbi:VOC family protein [Corynebacterium variabile]|uniref:VOC family protein n=1 Tax=Corynebacterium variabile TaxID=1727 RepID=UPI0035E4292F
MRLRSGPPPTIDRSRDAEPGVVGLTTPVDTTTTRQVKITFDFGEPAAVAESRKAPLGYGDPPVPPRFDCWEAFNSSLPEEDQGSPWACQDPEGVGPSLFFQRVPGPETVGNHVHLDVRVGTGLRGDEPIVALEAKATRLEASGAPRAHLVRVPQGVCGRRVW